MTLFIQLYLAWSALLITGITLLLIRKFKPNMLKTIIVTAMVLFAAAATPTASADSSANCSYLDSNTSISDAEDLMIYTALEAMDNGQNMESAGQQFAKDIVANCPEHIDTILQAADNISNDPRYN